MTMPKKNALEWTVFAVSVLLIAGVVGVLVYAAVRSPDRPPDLRVSVGAPVAAQDGTYRLPVTVRNDGNETAEQATVEVSLESDGRQVERAQFTIAFVPRRSSREGWVVFRRDPRCCDVKTRPVGFEKP